MNTARHLLLAAVSTVALAACAAGPNSSKPELAFSQAPEYEYKSVTLNDLMMLPPPPQKIPVAVYRFEDQTGQNKTNDQFAEYSRAVTQGGTAILINALERAGNKSWFTPVERASLQTLLQERQIIRTTRQEYGGEKLPPLRPLTYAGVMLEGGIIGYDANTLTGGAGARFLGIGGDIQYRRDTATVYLRAVSVQNGEVLKSVNVSKTIYSTALNGGAFKYVSFKKLLEIEAGVTTNEPTTLAVKQAVEKAVYALAMEGLIDGYWLLADMSKSQALIDAYWRERDGIYDVSAVLGAAAPAPVAVEPAPAREPTGTGPDSPETKLQPPIEPGLPAPPPGPTYIVPGQQAPNRVPGGLLNRSSAPPPSTETAPEPAIITALTTEPSATAALMGLPFRR